MPNIYVFYKGNTAPSGWTRTTSYDGRYARCGATHGATSGNTTHTHTLSSYSVGTCGTAVIYTGMVNFGLAHANHALTMGSCGAENNDPPYYTLILIYRDATTFESSVKAFPSGVVVASSAAISNTEYTRESAIDSRLIKLGDYGTTGGRSATTAGHACSFTLGAYTPGSVQSSNPFVGSTPSWKSVSHTHTCSGTSATATTLPKKVTTRLYTTNTTTTSIPVNVVCFFDGTPSANWTYLSAWDGACIYGGDSSPTVDGADTHTHGNLSMTSSAGGTNNAASTASVKTACCSAHTHSVTATLSSGNHLPPSVDLVPYYLNTTLYPQVTLDKTCDIDIVLKRVQTKTADMDIVLKRRDIDKTADVDIVLKIAQATTWQVGIAMKKAQEATYGMDFLARKALDLGYDSDILMKKPLELDYETDLLVKKVQGKSYETDLLVKKVQEKDYETGLLVKKALDSTHDIDILMKKALDSTYGANLLAKKTLDKTYQAGLVVISGRKIDYDISLKLIKSINFDYLINILLLKIGEELNYTASLSLASFIHKKYDANLFLRKAFPLEYSASIFLTNRLTTYPADIAMRKALQILYFIGLRMQKPWDKTYAAGLLVEKSLETSYGMEMALFTMSIIHYQASIRIWGHRDIFYGMTMKARKGDIESGYGAKIKIILPSQKLRPLRLTEEEPAERIYPEGSSYSPTDLIPGPHLRPTEEEPAERIYPEGSSYSPTDLIPGPHLKPTEKESPASHKSEGSPYSPTDRIQFQRRLRPGKSQY